MNSLHEKEMAFFGAIVASVSHELNNALSIINEYGGLLEDITYSSKNGNPIEGEKIEKISNSISKQIKRERDLIKLVNRFAHRVDEPRSSFNLHQNISDILTLCQRFAGLKRVNLTYTPPEDSDSISLCNNPFGLQHLIFRCIKLLLESAKRDETILVSILKKGHPTVTISFPPQNQENVSDLKERMDLISELALSLGGKITFTYTGDDQHHCILDLIS